MIINILFRLLLTFNATSLLIIIFLVQRKYTLFYFFQHEQSLQWLSGIPQVGSYLFYFLIPVVLTKVSLVLSAALGKDEFKKGEVISVEHANNSFLPSYLGYFFVALSINNWGALFFVYGVLFIYLRPYISILCFLFSGMSFIILRQKQERRFFLSVLIGIKYRKIL